MLGLGVRVRVRVRVRVAREVLQQGLLARGVHAAVGRAVDAWLGFGRGSGSGSGSGVGLRLGLGWRVDAEQQ